MLISGSSPTLTNCVFTKNIDSFNQYGTFASALYVVNAASNPDGMRLHQQ